MPHRVWQARTAHVPPPDTHALIPGICECHLCGQQTKFRASRWGGRGGVHSGLDVFIGSLQEQGQRAQSLTVTHGEQRDRVTDGDPRGAEGTVTDGDTRGAEGQRDASSLAPRVQFGTSGQEHRGACEATLELSDTFDGAQPCGLIPASLT